MKKSSVLVCESQFLSRTGLKHIIDKNPFFSVEAEAHNFESLERILGEKKFDIITLDYTHDGEFDEQAISLIQESSPLTHILIISNEKNKRSIYDVLGHGINHYITKNCREDEIYKALDACMKDQKYYCSKVLDIIIDKTFGQNNKESDNPLTQREQEIVQLIAQGKMAKEISSILKISIHTIYTHRKNVMKKLNISSPVQLVTYAINKGLVEI